MLAFYPSATDSWAQWDNCGMDTVFSTIRFDNTTLALVLTAVFALGVAIDGCVKLILAARQTKHVMQHRAAVPANFAQKISLEAHQKAADYTAAKMHFATIEILVGAALLMGWTLMGGLDLLNRVLVAQLGDSMAYQIGLVLAFSIIGGLIDLPFSWWRTFRLEAKFGFNRTNLKTWLTDLAKGTFFGALLGLPLLWAEIGRAHV